MDTETVYNPQAYTQGLLKPQTLRVGLRILLMMLVYWVAFIKKGCTISSIDLQNTVILKQVLADYQNVSATKLNDVVVTSTKTCFKITSTIINEF